jgi:hypothetical protein
MLAVVADRTGTVAFNLCRAVVRSPDDANILTVRFFVAAPDGSIKLHKKNIFAGDGEISHHASFKITASSLIRSIATFITYIGAEQFFVFLHSDRANS